MSAARISVRRSTGDDAYWDRTKLPLQCLYFLLPLIVMYELGVLWYATDAQGTQHIVARSRMLEFFQWVGMGVSAPYLPGLLIVVALLVWHVMRGRDPWRPQPALCLGMLVESLVWSVPLLVLGLVIRPVLFGPVSAAAVSLAASPSAEMNWQAELAVALGAGVYEELLFRVIGLALVHGLFVDLFPLPARHGATLAIIATSLAFAFYHFSTANPFHVGKLVFYSLAGAYFAAVYLLRGYGVAAGTHAVYDVLVALLRWSSQA